MRLTDIFIKIFTYVAYLMRTSSPPPIEQVKADIERLILESEADFEKGGFERENYDLARFAVYAWVDEMIMSSNWPGKDAWLKSTLQRTYFQTASAGDLFFERLNALGPHQQDVREVYYLCLSMGFMGKYCNEGDDYLLEQLKLSNLKLLTGTSVGLPSFENETLFPEAYPTEAAESGPAEKRSLFSPLNIVAVFGPVAVFIVLFFIYQFVLRNLNDNIMAMVK